MRDRQPLRRGVGEVAVHVALRVDHGRAPRRLVGDEVRRVRQAREAVGSPHRPPSARRPVPALTRVTWRPPGLAVPGGRPRPDADGRAPRVYRASLAPAAPAPPPAAPRRDLLFAEEVRPAHAAQGAPSTMDGSRRLTWLPMPRRASPLAAMRMRTSTSGLVVRAKRIVSVWRAEHRDAGPDEDAARWPSPPLRAVPRNVSTLTSPLSSSVSSRLASPMRADDRDVLREVLLARHDLHDVAEDPRALLDVAVDRSEVLVAEGHVAGAPLPAPLGSVGARRRRCPAGRRPCRAARRGTCPRRGGAAAPARPVGSRSSRRRRAAVPPRGRGRSGAAGSGRRIAVMRRSPGEVRPPAGRTGASGPRAPGTRGRGGRDARRSGRRRRPRG